jgi:hypothetical protein
MMRRSSRVERLQETLDLLVLRILLFGPFHGAASERIESCGATSARHMPRELLKSSSSFVFLISRHCRRCHEKAP